MNNAGRFSVISILLLAAFIVAMVVVLWPSEVRHKAPPDVSERSVMELPPPAYSSETSVERALFERRSVRTYAGGPLALSDISQLLWAAQGITEKSKGYRTAPSAGALYPLEVYVFSGDVMGLPAGIYRYRPSGHELMKIAEGDKRQELFRAALNQPAVRQAPADIVFSARYGRTMAKYGKRGIRYVNTETGSAVENVYLQAVSLGLGTVVVGAFDDSAVKDIIGMDGEEEPLYIMPVGKKGQ